MKNQRCKTADVVKELIERRAARWSDGSGCLQRRFQLRPVKRRRRRSIRSSSHV